MTVIPRSRVSGRYRPIITIILIVINIVVYVYTSIDSENPLISSSYTSIANYGFKPIYIFTDYYTALITVFTSMFTHADLFHILFNMYFLWIFGSRVEGFLGHVRFLLLYFLSGISAVLFHVAFIPIGGYTSMGIPAVGASGSISGVLGAYLLLLPYTKLTICTFIFLIPYCFTLPASAFLLIWFAQQVIYGYMRLGGVAYFAHIGGFVMGLAMIPLITRFLREKWGYIDHLSRYIIEYYGISVIKPRGLGIRSKVILVILLLVVVSGFMYSIYSQRNTLIYSLSVYARSGVVGQNDTLALVVSDSRLYVTESVFDVVRILVNRLTPVLYSESLRSTETRGDFRYVTKVSGLEVDVFLLDTVMVYDDEGILKHSGGKMISEVVMVGSYGYIKRGGRIELSFETKTTRGEASLSLLISIVSTAISLLAINSVIRADELTVLTEPINSGLYPYL